MSEQYIEFEFNTAITALPDSGEFDKDAHAAQVEPLFRRIKSRDGIWKCYIGPYGGRVEYMSNVINAEQAFAVVQEAIEWAAKSKELKLFPLRGMKKPQVTFNRPPQPAPRYRRKVVVTFGTHIVAFPSRGNGEWDEEKFKELVSEFASRLADTEGVTGCKVALDGAQLIFDTRLNTEGEVIRHIEATIDEVMETKASGTDFAHLFPYLDTGSGLNLDYQSGDA